MESPLPETLRYDGLWWRKFAALGSTYGPEWWKRSSPPVIGAACFAMIGANRRGAVANMRRVLGEDGRNPTTTALRMFVEFAYCLSETLERFGPRPLPVRVDLPSDDAIRDAVEAGRGAVVVTGHFGNWDIAALELLRYERPTHVVMAHEQNQSANPYVEQMREHLGLHIVYSDRSVLSSLELLHALRRNEIVALQIDRLAASDSAREVEMFGSNVRLPSGPFELARLSGAPLIPVFAPRVGTRHYRIHLGQPWGIRRDAGLDEIQSCIAGVAKEMQEMIRLHPDQWFQFEPFWTADAGAASRPAAAAAPQASHAGVRSRGVERLSYARRDAAMRSRTASRRRSRSS
jgi:phosphatidylinositol dimannoside acyltransferase